MRGERILDAAERRALARLRRLAAPLDGAVEVRSFGHPAFKAAGRLFAVLDRYRGEPCLWLRVDPLERTALIARRGWFAAPYDPRCAALCCRLEAIDWRRIGARVRDSYALATLGSGARRPRPPRDQRTV